MEIERKFRLTHLPQGVRKDDYSLIRQGYLFSDDDVELRLREKDGKYFMTCKGCEDEKGLAREEWERKIPSWMFDGLWPGTFRVRIEKRRYTLEGPNGLVFEIDVFLGSLRGLIILEVEFKDKDAAEHFEIPVEFRGIEVTNDDSYKNKHLAIFGIPT